MTSNTTRAFEQVAIARKACEELRTRYHSNLWYEAFTTAFDSMEALNDEAHASKDVALIEGVYCGHITTLINTLLEESKNKISVHAFAGLYAPLENARRFFQYELEDIEDTE